MKNLSILLCAVILAASCNEKKLDSKVMLKDGRDSLAYAMGAMMGAGLKPKKIKDFNWEVFKKAVEYSMVHGDSGLAINKDKILEVYDLYSNMELKKEADEFVAKKRKEGKYKPTTTGLLFNSLKPGNGIKPSITDSVLVFYTGTFADGKVFQSNFETGQPAQFGMNSQSIKGFLEALSMMEEGSEAEVVIPYELAYGVKGNVNPYTGQVIIEPYQNLLFKIKLEKILH